MNKLMGFAILLGILSAEEGRGVEFPPLKEKAVFDDASLMGVTSVVLSPDQRFAYCAAWGADAISTFSRNPETGELKKIGALADKKKLRNVVAVRLSGDGKYAAAAISSGDGVVLFERDPETGMLTELDYATDQNPGQEMVKYVIEVVFSPDGRFLYAGTLNGIVTFEIMDDKLSPVDLKGMAGKTSDCRSVDISADGRFLYAVFKDSNSFATFKRDAATGKLKLFDIHTDGEGGVEGIEGPSYAIAGPENKFVYVSGARWGGDDSVSVFRHGRDGRLEIVQQLDAGKKGVPEFNGGNETKISPDGAFYYMTATNTDTLIRFARNPRTGRLKVIDSIEVGRHVTPGASGLCFSADGKMVYVADENSGSVVQYSIETAAEE